VATFGQFFFNERDFPTEYFDFFKIFFTKWLLKFANKKNCHCAFCQTQHPVHKCCIKIILLSHTGVFSSSKIVVKYSTGGVALSSLGLYNGVWWFFTHVLKNLQFGF
jgi:hypothetical protein